MKPTLFGMAVALGLAIPLVLSEEIPSPKHVIVFKEPGRFGGWPANHGIWSWGNEILVGFEIGYFQKRERGHAIDYSRPAGHAVARSLDGGETWTVEQPPALQPPAGVRVAGVPSAEGGKASRPFDGKIDFTSPGFALAARMEDIHVGPSRFYYSLDRGKSWSGPFIIPNFGQKGIAARTDYLVDGPEELTMFLTAAKESDGKQGRPICVRTNNGGRDWQIVGLVGPEPPPGEKAIMPSSVRVDEDTILTARRQRSYIDLCRSDDNGATWTKIGIPIPDTGQNNGNPPQMIQLQDGTLVLTYGYRSAPYGIRARYSRNQGADWSDEIVLRNDGGCWDLGYTRSVQRPDGKIVTVYYFNDAEDEERYIAATIWELN